MFFEQIFEEKLAQYAYLIGCQATGEAIIIDPMRDIERYEKLAKKHNLKLIAAAETHIHADYLSGMRELAEKGVKIYVSDEGDADWKYNWAIGSSYDYQLLKDGDEFAIGNIRFKVLYSPGHTPEHISFMVTDGAATDEPMGILSGDFVFVGDVGRPDLLESAAGVVGAMEDSAKTLYKSIQRFMELPEYLQMWPGHGAGSACGKALGAVPESTVGYEQRFNGSIRAASSEQQFVDYILDGQPEPPLYFARMKRDNKQGPRVLGELPKPARVSVDEMISASNAAIVDTRERMEYIRGHLQGSIYAPVNKQFNTIVGSYVDDETDVYLIIDEDQVNEAVIDLIRIGIDRVVGYVTIDDFNAYEGNLATIPMINFEDVDRMMSTGAYRILDVRKKSEYDEGHHPEAINIAHTRLADRYNEIPRDKPVLVHCKSGVRASAAISLLEKEGFDVQYINDLVDPWLASKQLVN